MATALLGVSTGGWATGSETVTVSTVGTAAGASETGGSVGASATLSVSTGGLLCRIGGGGGSREEGALAVLLVLLPGGGGVSTTPGVVMTFGVAPVLLAVGGAAVGTTVRFVPAG